MLYFLGSLNLIYQSKHTVKSHWISHNNCIISKSWKHFLTYQVNIHKVKQMITVGCCKKTYLHFLFTQDWKNWGNLYFGHFKLVHLDDFYLIFMQFTIYHWKNLTSVYFIAEIFGHGHVQCYDFVDVEYQFSLFLYI